MKTIKVSEATDIQLDWLVAKAEGFDAVAYEIKRKAQNRSGWMAAPKWSPTANWSQMGPILDREKISIRHWDNTPVIHAYLPTPGSDWSEGQTPLIAAARCYVTSKLGATAAIPDEL